MFAALENTAFKAVLMDPDRSGYGSGAMQEMSFRWLTMDQLAQYEAEWTDLSEHAAIPNPEYGPGTILAFVEAFEMPGDVHIASVWSNMAGQPRLDALGFYVRDDFRWGWPVKTWVAWHHKYSSLTEPLVRRDSDLAALRTLYDGLSDNRADKTLLLLKGQSGTSDRPAQLLDDRLLANAAVDWQKVVSAHERAALLPHWTPDAYLMTGLTGKKRQKLRCAKRKLEALGTLKVETVNAGPRLEAAFNDYLMLEERSWKGEQGTALACQKADLQFAQLLRKPGTHPHISCDVLSLDGTAIAVTVNLVSGDCLFGFKSAFDETYAKNSPGSLLHHEAALAILRNRKLKMADSVTLPGHPIESIWPDRLTAGRVLQSVGAPVNPRMLEHCLQTERLRMTVRSYGRHALHKISHRKVVRAAN